MKNYLGFYEIMGNYYEVTQANDQLCLLLPNLPPGFEVKLEPQPEPHTFVLRGGQYDGRSASFQLDATGEVTGLLVAGTYELVKQNGPPSSPDIPTGQGLDPPSLNLDEGQEQAFQSLLAEILERGDGSFIDYRLPFPKHAFLQFAAAQDTFIFHGSGNPDIDEFRTRRTSMELNDHSGRGNVQGIYGTHDGLWPIFFAIVDRERLRGSIRNGFDLFSNEAGETVKRYHFSINKDYLPERPYRTGTLYILPRDSFRRLPASNEGGFSNEWVSEVPVRPLARLEVAPEDFPFLEQIGGHDDSALLNFTRLGEELLAAGLEVAELEDGFALQIEWSDEMRDRFFAYLPLFRQFMPQGRLVLRFEPEGINWLEIAGPPAFKQVLADRIRG